jgi:uroporphyrin-III C-methyltransferase
LSPFGKVFLVGAGPGDPDLLTLKAAKVLRSADLVLHDELVSVEILRLIPATARLINVGKRCGKKSTPQEEINRLLVRYASLGRDVVRLKGGDPFIFGRGGEELEALRQAGIEFEIVPGITAALGAAASIQVPLTHREMSPALVLLTGSSKSAEAIASWPDRLPSNATIVVYMPGHNLPAFRERLLSSGVLPETPCAMVSSATNENEQVHISTVNALADSPHLSAPRLLVIGEVVRLARPSHLVRQFEQFSRQSEATLFARENAE